MVEYRTLAIAHPLETTPLVVASIDWSKLIAALKSPQNPPFFRSLENSGIATQSSIHNPRAAAGGNQTYLKPSPRPHVSVRIWYAHCDHQKFPGPTAWR